MRICLHLSDPIAKSVRGRGCEFDCQRRHVSVKSLWWHGGLDEKRGGVWYMIGRTFNEEGPLLGPARKR